DLAHHLDVAVRGLGDRSRLPCEHCAGGRFGIQGVGLAVGAPRAPVATVDLDNAVSGAPRRAGEPRAVAAGAFDPERFDAAELLSPADQLPVAARICGEGTVLQARAP